MTGWFQRLNSRGHVVSGAGQLFVNGHPVGEVGWNPVWFTDDRFIYNAAERGLRLYDVQTKQSVPLDPRELIELAAGGGKWAGRHAPTDALIVSDGDVIEGAGQPCIAADGELIYRRGDDKIEPSICLAAEAWGDGRGRILARRVSGLVVIADTRDCTVGDFEARPILIDTLEGPWVLCMTRTGLHLRPLFGSHGYAIATGNDRNLHAHAVCLGTTIRAVWQDTQGHPFAHDFDLSAPRVPLPVTADPIVAPPDPVIPADPQAPGDAMFPEKLRDGRPLRDVVRVRLKATGLLGHGADEQERRDNAVRANVMVAIELNAIEGREVFGLRSKHRAGWSQLPLKDGGTIGLFSDLLAYRHPDTGTAYSVDTVTSAEAPTAGTGWTNEGPIDDHRHRFVAPSELALTGGDGPDPGDEDDQVPPPADPLDVPPQPTQALALLRVIALLEQHAAQNYAIVSELAALRSAQGEQTAAITSGLAEIRKEVQDGVRIRFS